MAIILPSNNWCIKMQQSNSNEKVTIDPVACIQEIARLNLPLKHANFNKTNANFALDFMFMIETKDYNC